MRPLSTTNQVKSWFSWELPSGIFGVRKSYHTRSLLDSIVRSDCATHGSARSKWSKQEACSNVYSLDRIPPSFSPTLRFHRRDSRHAWRLWFRFLNGTTPGRKRSIKRANESKRFFQSRSRIDRVFFKANFTPRAKSRKRLETEYTDFYPLWIKFYW